MTSLNLYSTIQTQTNSQRLFLFCDMRPVHHFSWNPLLRGTLFLNLAMWKCEAQHWCWLMASLFFLKRTRTRKLFLFSAPPTYNEWFWLTTVNSSTWSLNVIQSCCFPTAAICVYQKITFELQSGDISHTRVNTNPTNGLDGLKPISMVLPVLAHVFVIFKCSHVELPLLFRRWFSSWCWISQTAGQRPRDPGHREHVSPDSSHRKRPAVELLSKQEAKSREVKTPTKS